MQTLAARTPVVLSGVDYSPGRRFVVLGRGAMLSGWVHDASGSRHWTVHLTPGDVITSTGFGFGDGTGFTPGFGVEWSSEESDAAGAVHVQLSPDRGGPWAHQPREGCLRPLDEEAEAALGDA